MAQMKAVCLAFMMNHSSVHSRADFGVYKEPTIHHYDSSFVKTENIAYKEMCLHDTKTVV